MSDVPPPVSLISNVSIKDILLMGPGPSNCNPRVMNAMTQPFLAPLDADLLKVMKETKEGIQYYFQTNNPMTFALSGTAHCAMETAIINVLEKEDAFLVIKTGIWGERALDIGERIGAHCHCIGLNIGEIVSLDLLSDVMSNVHPALLFVCHGDSSTGLFQPLHGISEICKKYDCLLLVDGVATIGALPLLMDKYGIDILYGGSQKVLSASPGISPISFSSKAMKKIDNRITPVPSFYMDVNLVGNYWNCDDGPIKYHHTGPVTLIYALREALSVLASETLEQSWSRHFSCFKILQAGLEKLGFEFLIENKKYRLPTVTAVKIPSGIDGNEFMDFLLQRYSIHIGGGLGPTKGSVFRIGLMGYNCTKRKVFYLLDALHDTLNYFKTRSRL